MEINRPYCHAPQDIEIQAISNSYACGECGKTYKVLIAVTTDGTKPITNTMQQEPQCDILTSTLVYSPQDAEYPKEWVCDKNGENPRCKAFIKWDWATQGNPHDPQNPNYLQPCDPNQLTLF